MCIGQDKRKYCVFFEEAVEGVRFIANKPVQT